MNFYVVVEGRVVEKEVYREWIPLVDRSLSYVTHPSLLTANTFTIVSGHGYPFYLSVIEDAIADVQASAVPVRLVVCVDSEEMTYEEKRKEIDDLIRSKNTLGLDYRIVVQHFCFETWALGNRRLSGPANLSDLAVLKQSYDVSRMDPEGLPSFPQRHLNRSQHAELYLRLLLNNKNKRITYSKANPEHVKHSKFFMQLRLRLKETSHIPSFRFFLDAFV